MAQFIIGYRNESDLHLTHFTSPEEAQEQAFEWVAFEAQSIEEAEDKYPTAKAIYDGMEMLTNGVPKTFFRSPFKQHEEHNHKEFTILGMTDPQRYDIAEVGPLFDVQLATGEVIHAWPLEIFKTTSTIK